MKRPDCIRHWRELEGPDDATYPDSPERFSIGAPLGRGLRLNRLGIHHEHCRPGGAPLIHTRRAMRKSSSTCWRAIRKCG